MSNPSIQAVRGMNDVLPDDVGVWQHVEQAIARVTAAYGYREIRVPVVERTELFKRSIGEQTDIVEKEMYTFTDHNGESLTLRPEATASCVRAGLQHGLFHNRQQRLWYLGPMFRHERPQKGRYRQFHQFGIEAFGWPGPDVDAEVILVAARLWRELGIEAVRLEINSLGAPEERARHREALVAYLGRHREALDADSQRRLETNPLRVLDSKSPTTQAVVSDAPRLTDYLGDASRLHFEGLRGYLEAAGVDYEIRSTLVRGLDYYTHTVFEWVTDRLGAQAAVCAGGRYDLLADQLGGRSVPGIGFALGIERLIELVRLGAPDRTWGGNPQVYVAAAGDAVRVAAMALAERLRDAGLEVVFHCDGGSLKRQMRHADRSGARFAVVLGEAELSRGAAAVKALRERAAQEEVSLEHLPRALVARLAQG